MSNSNQQQMIYDLIDGQLSADQIEQAQQLIAEDVELAELYQSLRDQQAALRAMPKYELDADFASRVVRAAQAEGLLDEAPAPSTLKLPTPTDKRNWWAPAMAITALAAMLLVTLFVIPNLPSANTVAQVDKKPHDSLADESDAEGQAIELDSDSVKGDMLNQESVANSQNHESESTGNSDPGSAGDSDPAMAIADNAAQPESIRQAIPRVARGHRGGEERGGNLNPSVESFSANDNGGRMMLMAKNKVVENRVLVFKVSEKEAAIRQINKAFSENGITVGLPETASQRTNRAPRNGFRANDSAVTERDGVEQREFAYRIQATPAQMQKAVLALRNQTEIVAVDSMGPAREMVGDQPPAAMTLNATDTSPDRMVQGRVQSQELRTQNFGSAKMRDAAPQKDSAQSGAGMEAAPLNNDVAQNQEKGEIAKKELRTIDEYFGLASNVDEVDVTPQSYTLIFMLDQAVAEGNLKSNALESDVAPPTAADQHDQRP